MFFRVIYLTLICTFLSAVFAYLLGSVNFSIIIVRFIGKGQDIRNLGSGNAGMTNVARNYGRYPAIAVTFLDLLKGIISVLFAWGISILGAYLFATIEAAVLITVYAGYTAGLCAVLGHMFPIFFRFKGGKGVLTSAGMILMLDPFAFCVVVLTFLLFFTVSRYVSLSSIAAAASYPVAVIVRILLERSIMLLNGADGVAIVSSLILCGLVVFMHRANIKRLLSGTESRVGKKKQ